MGDYKDDLATRGLDAFAPYLMNRIMRRYNQTLQSRMADYDLSAPKMRTLASLAVRDGLTVNELAVYSLAEQPTMSRTLDQLERDGFITRTVSETDSRVRHCSLTDAGREMYQLTWPEMDAAEQVMFEGVSNEDRAHLLATLGRMLGNIKQNDF